MKNDITFNIFFNTLSVDIDNTYIITEFKLILKEITLCLTNLNSVLDV